MFLVIFTGGGKDDDDDGCLIKRKGKNRSHLLIMYFRRNIFFSMRLKHTADFQCWVGFR